jgi:hypothetical protein
VSSENSSISAMGFSRLFSAGRVSLDVEDIDGRTVLGGVLGGKVE